MKTHWDAGPAPALVAARTKTNTPAVSGTLIVAFNSSPSTVREIRASVAMAGHGMVAVPLLSRMLNSIVWLMISPFWLMRSTARQAIKSEPDVLRSTVWMTGAAIGAK